jgi:hypothetical protein
MDLKLSEGLVRHSIQWLTLQKVSKWVSVLLHPFIIAPVAVILVLYMDSGDIWLALRYAGLCAAIVIGPSLAFILVQLARRRYSDADVSIRSERHSLYIVGGLCMVACFGVLLWLGAPRLLMVLFITGFITIVLFAIITRVWLKLSIHAGTLASTAVVVAFYSLPLASFLALATLLVSWSRLTLRRHSLSETLAGLALGTIAAVIGMSWR